MHDDCQSCQLARVKFPRVHDEVGPDDVHVSLPCGISVGIPGDDVEQYDRERALEDHLLRLLPHAHL